MRKYIIADIDKKVCKGGCASFTTAMRRIEKYIIENIDETFPIEQFKEWYNGDSEKPFIWNKKSYHWS